MGMSRINTRYLFEKSRWAPFLPFLYLVLSGLIFLGVFYFRYSTIDKDWFQYRDDGVITMSVGRNIVDYGFVGVNPSGPIVEAASSPLQILIYALSYKYLHLDFAKFSWVQTYVCSFLLGMLFMAFFLERSWVGLGMTAMAALILTYIYPFFQWHGSGMENALTHCLFLLTLFLLYRSVKISRINYFFVLPIFCASIVRSESFVHIGLLLIFFSLFWYKHFKTLEGFRFSIFISFLWGGFQLLRYLYFGDFLPNTAHAQEISVSKNVLALIRLDWTFISESVKLCVDVVRKNRVWLVLGCVPMLFGDDSKSPSKKFFMVAGLLVTLSLSLSPFLFGKARIDIARTTTQITPIIFVLLTYSIVFSKNIKWGLLECGVWLLMFVAFSCLVKNKPYKISGNADIINRAQIERVKNIVQSHSIGRATVASQDLGLISWNKDFNIVDLGALGSPEIARFSQIKDRFATRNYFLNRIAPDVIVAYWGSVTDYCDWMLSNGFQEQYEMLFRPNDLKEICESGSHPARLHFWVRRDIKKNSKSRERYFLDLMQAKLEPAAIRDELSFCHSVETSCDYVARTVYRFIPELRKMGQFDEVFSFFSDPIDRAILEGWRNPKAYLALKKGGQSQSQRTSFFIMNR